MAMKKSSSGDMHPNPFNEVDNKDPNKPDVMGDDLYYDGWDEVMAMHLKETGPMVSTPNSEASHDTFGGPAKGEPDPAGTGGK